MREDERSPGTIENYVRHVRAFAAWMGGIPPQRKRQPHGRNTFFPASILPAPSTGCWFPSTAFSISWGWQECKVKPLRIQRRLFREESKELTREEYQRLLAAARALGRERLELLMETICATGIRVSEVKYITVEALACGKVEISLKGKIRTILIPGKLCKKLKKYAKKKRTVSGEIFITKNGTGFPENNMGRNESDSAKGPRWLPAKCSPTTCGTCSRAPFIRCAGTLPTGGRLRALQYRDSEIARLRSFPIEKTLFKVAGREPAQGRMGPDGVVKRLDVGEKVGLGGPAGIETAQVNQLAF